MNISVRNDGLIPDDTVGPIRKHLRCLNLEQLIQVNQIGRAHVELGLDGCDGAYAPRGEANRDKRDIT